ncbi:hypothetical protein [Mycobacterium sp. ACS4331]|uniref:hypothetical protein n=1 Tax=Mycobacterium sp. ACS4331 TaxID=1834121 RepID=UPI0007FD2FBD|nr:hypothetical protein [Mycobacterium sp. ACS4331]OBF29773.1 hypothetical protein A5727_23170 [Mycobacterium sp. ACS4331]
MELVERQIPTQRVNPTDLVELLELTHPLLAQHIPEVVVGGVRWNFEGDRRFVDHTVLRRVVQHGFVTV